MTTTISMLAIDLAKGSFQVCTIGLDGAVLFNRVLSRTRLATLLAEQPACLVAMEACATSHHWGRVAQSHGHEVRLVPAVYVKPFVKRQKNDKADAEAIAEAASRPTMRFADILDRIHAHEIRRLDELLPWQWSAACPRLAFLPRSACMHWLLSLRSQDASRSRPGCVVTALPSGLSRAPSPSPSSHTC